MKKVAGTLRLELAQYRELQAFSQFGSDLDTATQEQLARGERLVEVLKQGQYQPVPVEQQILQIYAATSMNPEGRPWLRDIEVKDVQAYIKELVEFALAKHEGVLKSIVEKKELTDEIKSRLDDLLATFTDAFLAERGQSKPEAPAAAEEAAQA